jgi:hypothetical protein
MLGYRYALSVGGHFLGRTILGDFFLANQALPKRQVIANARSHFQPYVALVRPVMGVRDTFKGTADDRLVYICERGSLRWALIVVIRTGPETCHGVLVPHLEEPIAAKIFHDFLSHTADQEVTARLCSYDGNSWHACPETVTHRWPFADQIAS